ncbi:MAG: DNA polymerase III subunit delta', partial [Desulfuromonadales bacterium]|nr:DNA polymerase III subunit delta' [Desulfuromonadales bacterium]
MSGEDLTSEQLAPPESNPELLGQTEAEEILLRAYNSGRLPHAWLLTG